MYEGFFGFSEKPFNLTPDPKYLYLSPRHTEAAAHLEFGRRERGGFIVITGEVGTGKTTLARHFLAHLPPSTATAVILYPALSALELLRSILDDLHITSAGPSLKDQVDALHHFLLAARREGRDVVLLIDEAQDLRADVLEQVRLLSNLETDTDKLIQIVLMGQSELRELLARPSLRQLAQRVTARYHLEPLSRSETEEYVRHRLAVAGGQGKVSFTAGAIHALHGLSSGIPRLVNLIADRALLAGFVRTSREIDASMVREAGKEALEVGMRRRPARRWATAVGTLAACAAGVVLALAVPRNLRAPDAAPADATGVGANAITPVAAVAPALPSPSPASTPTPTPSPSAPDDARLEALLTTLPRGGSRDAAFQRVAALWGASPLERTPLRTHLDQVRRLDFPVVLEVFHPTRRDTAFVALLGLDHDQAEIAVGSEPPLHVSAATLDRFWTRDAVVIWRDVLALGRGEQPARTERFVRESLWQLGFSPEPSLSEAVGRFQKDVELLPDGRVGNRTLMALYGASAYPRPRLKSGGKVS
jgi:general secretion pathway protein A